jgi:hypothetical protein
VGGRALHLPLTPILFPEGTVSKYWNLHVGGEGAKECPSASRSTTANQRMHLYSLLTLRYACIARPGRYSLPLVVNFCVHVARRLRYTYQGGWKLHERLGAVSLSLSARSNPVFVGVIQNVSQGWY